jgi:hypothetical protein
MYFLLLGWRAVIILLYQVPSYIIPLPRTQEAICGYSEEWILVRILDFSKASFRMRISGIL